MGVFGKKGDTITNFVLIVGLLFVSMAAIGILRSIAISQARTVQQDYTVAVVEDVKQVVDKANSYPDNSEYLIKLKDPIIYQMNVTGNKISFYFPKLDISKEIYISTSDARIIPSIIDTSGEIKVYRKDNNIYITDNLVCNTTDDRCDVGCIAEGKCDKSCYKKEVINGICNPYCLDTNKDGNINTDDSDSICDPDCYNNFRDGFYDIDCIDPADSICDPDTNNILDGICDRDCIGTNGVCDPDCPEFDADCPSKGNGRCEPERGESCMDYPAFDDCKCGATQFCADCASLGEFGGAYLDEKGCIEPSALFQKEERCIESCQCSQAPEKLLCDIRFGTNRCCPIDSYYKEGTGCVNYKNDGECRTEEPYSETCENSADCRCQSADLCCPSCSGAEASGCCPVGTKQCAKSTGAVCIIPGGKSEAQKCECPAECNSGLICSENKADPTDKACCSADTDWNGTSCEITDVWDVVFVALNFQETAADNASYRNAANIAINAFMAKSPFRECSDPMSKIKVHYLDQKDCRITCSDICGDCNDLSISCVVNSEYSTIWDKIIAINGESAASGIMGCASGIPGDSSVTRVNMPIVVVHETGHALGLCHLNCGGAGGACLSWCPNKDDCSPPQTSADVRTFIMDYCDGFDRYGPNAYNHLKTVSLKQWLKNC
ncbi:MAG: hypothetical protein NTV63_03415 [Candidatus Woesearchaeota archaeon]|nr:hypothetical protein [Candidatus Woesearchaeota archaeon]